MQSLPLSEMSRRVVGVALRMYADHLRHEIAAGQAMGLRSQECERVLEYIEVPTTLDTDDPVGLLDRIGEQKPFDPMWQKIPKDDQT